MADSDGTSYTKLHRCLQVWEIHLRCTGFNHHWKRQNTSDFSNHTVEKCSKCFKQYSFLFFPFQYRVSKFSNNISTLNRSQLVSRCHCISRSHIWRAYVQLVLRRNSLIWVQGTIIATWLHTAVMKRECRLLILWHLRCRWIAWCTNWKMDTTYVTTATIKQSLSLKVT